MFKRNKEVMMQESEEVDVEVEENIYVMMPVPGTIIGEATEEEMDKAADLEVRHAAFTRLQDFHLQFEGNAYKELLADFIQFETESTAFWRSVARRLSVPYEWPIRIDHANGPVYIGDSGEMPVLFDEEDGEEA